MIQAMAIPSKHISGHCFDGFVHSTTAVANSSGGTSAVYATGAASNTGYGTGMASMAITFMFF